MDLKPIQSKSTSQIKINSRLKVMLKMHASEINQSMRYVVEELLYSYFESIGLKDSTFRWTKADRASKDV